MRTQWWLRRAPVLQLSKAAGSNMCKAPATYLQLRRRNSLAACGWLVITRALTALVRSAVLTRRPRTTSSRQFPQRAQEQPPECWATCSGAEDARVTVRSAHILRTRVRSVWEMEQQLSIFQLGRSLCGSNDKPAI